MEWQIKEQLRQAMGEPADIGRMREQIRNMHKQIKGLKQTNNKLQHANDKLQQAVVLANKTTIENWFLKESISNLEKIIFSMLKAGYQLTKGE